MQAKMISVEVEMDQIIMAGMVFRAVNVRMAGISPFHGLRAVTGGVLRSSVKAVLGAAVCPTFSDSVSRGYSVKSYGFSVRCLRD